MSGGLVPVLSLLVVFSSSLNERRDKRETARETRLSVDIFFLSIDLNLSISVSLCSFSFARVFRSDGVIGVAGSLRYASLVPGMEVPDCLVKVTQVRKRVLRASSSSCSCCPLLLVYLSLSLLFSSLHTCILSCLSSSRHQNHPLSGVWRWENALPFLPSALIPLLNTYLRNHSTRPV